MNPSIVERLQTTDFSRGSGDRTEPTAQAVGGGQKYQKSPGRGDRNEAPPCAMVERTFDAPSLMIFPVLRIFRRCRGFRGNRSLPTACAVGWSLVAAAAAVGAMTRSKRIWHIPDPTGLVPVGELILH